MQSSSDRGRRLTRRAALRLGLYGAVAAGAGPWIASCGREHAQHRSARHVIFVSLDTTRPDHFGCYLPSCLKTPRVDALARESICFLRHMTPVTTTLAAHTSMFTGMYPHHHGVPRNGFMVNRANRLLPQVLKEAGFHTAGFPGSFALDSRFDFSRGFDFYDESFDILAGLHGYDQNQRLGARVTDAALAYVDRVGVPEKLFLFVHYFDPHKPYAAPPPFGEMYREVRPGETPCRETHPILRVARRPPEYEDMILRYAGEISYTDNEVGRLLDGLGTRGVLDDAILIVTSDHGEHLTDAQGGRPFDHGWTVYEAEARTLLLVRMPGGEHAGASYASRTSHIDLFPTLLGYLGVREPGGVDGEKIDLARLSPLDPERPLFSEGTKPWQDVETDPCWFNARKARSVVRGDYKYIRTLYMNSEELFDLSRDPLEQHDLLRRPALEHTSLARELAGVLDAWAATAKPLPTHFEPVQQEETKERLRSLGYL
jgi:arylsulfatase A-like enzyme